MSQSPVNQNPVTPNPVVPNIAQRVIQTIAKIKQLSPDQITLDRTFQSLDIDSLDGMTILFEVESEFDVNVPDDQVPKIRSVGEMVRGIEMLLAQKQSPAPDVAQ